MYNIENYRLILLAAADRYKQPFNHDIPIDRQLDEEELVSRSQSTAIFVNHALFAMLISIRLRWLSMHVLDRLWVMRLSMNTWWAALIT